jgi:hypothetical protein
MTVSAAVLPARRAGHRSDMHTPLGLSADVNSVSSIEFGVIGRLNARFERVAGPIRRHLRSKSQKRVYFSS